MELVVGTEVETAGVVVVFEGVQGRPEEGLNPYALVHPVGRVIFPPVTVTERVRQLPAVEHTFINPVPGVIPIKLRILLFKEDWKILL